MCGRCLTAPPPWSRIVAPFRYAEPVSSLIWQLKYQSQLHVARTLGLLFAAYRQHELSLPDLIMPVPLHEKRLRQRGYNQALELARVLGRVLHLPVDTTSCDRSRETRDQLLLGPRQRELNMRHAFAVVRPLTCCHIAVVDDVLTTGSTAAALVRCLHEHGVERVDVWVMARASKET